jgi:threonine dehydrogenase-like Zn-dependent dehydrogenase
MMFEPNDQGMLASSSQIEVFLYNSRNEAKNWDCLGLILGKNPVTMGHEASGTVVELGDGVSDFKVGDKVGFLPALDCCFECEPCRKT